MGPKAKEEKCWLSEEENEGFWVFFVLKMLKNQRKILFEEAKLHKFSPGRLPAPQKEEKRDSKKWILGFPQGGNEIGLRKKNYRRIYYNDRARTIISRYEHVREILER